MFSRNQIAAIAVLLGGVAATGAVAPQAYASGAGGCDRGVVGDKSCVHRSATAFTTREGKHVVIKQLQRCATASRQRLIWPENGLLGRGDTEIGPHMNCSNGFRLPKGFKRPHFVF